MHRVFEAFIDGLAASGDAESLRKVLAEAGVALDLSCFAYLSPPSRRGDLPKLISTYPSQWTDRNLRQRYKRLDPVIVSALATPEPLNGDRNFIRDAAGPSGKAPSWTRLRNSASAADREGPREGNATIRPH